MSCTPESQHPVVSVIVPVCNVETYLDECLASLCGQTLRAIEILAIDDGSTDDSLAILEKWAAKDPRVKVTAKSNEGYGATCNRGIDHAQGTWISIIEPDDWVEPTMYEDMVAFANSFDEPIDIIKTPWTDWQDWDDPATMHSVAGSLKGRLKTSEKPFTLTEHPVLIEGHPSIWSAIYRREFLNENHIRFIPYPGAGWADNPFLIETMVKAKAIAYLDRPYYNYRADLAYATLDHSTPEAIARPFERWLDMTDILDREHVSDRGILEAHYLRGFNYADGAVYDDGEDNPVVVQKTYEMFSRMDPQIVYWHPKLRSRRKKYYQKVMNQQRPLVFNPRRARYLVDETIYQFANRGGLAGLEQRLERYVKDRHIEKGHKPDEDE